MRWKIFEGALNTDILTDFLKRLVRDAGSKVYLILDDLRMHHSKPVKAWLADHKHIFYLASYSPELNHDEMALTFMTEAEHPGSWKTLRGVRASPGEGRSIL